MPTNPLGAGTCNLCVNVRRSVHATLGRMAFRADVSLGALVRWAIDRMPTITRTATAAERDDLAAIDVLERARRDGLSDADGPAIEQAIALIAQSAAKDRQLSDARISQ